MRLSWRGWRSRGPFSAHTTDVHQNRSEYADILAKRVVFSRGHTILCTSMLIAGCVEVLWILLPMGSGVGSLPDHPLFLLVESYVTLGLLCEILLRLVLQRGSFCKRWSNVFDVSVAAISVVSSALFAAGLETPAEMLLGTIIVTARIVFRLLRLVSLSRGFRQQQYAADRKLDVCMDVEEGADGELSPGAGSPGTPPASASCIRTSRNSEHWV